MMSCRLLIAQDYLDSLMMTVSHVPVAMMTAFNFPGRDVTVSNFPGRLRDKRLHYDRNDSPSAPCLTLS